MTTPTFSSSSAIDRAAFFDELTKLAGELTDSEREVLSSKLNHQSVNPEYDAGRLKTEPRWKRVAKAGLAAGAGYSLGHAGAMLADVAVTKALKKRYPNIAPDAKRKMLYPLLGISMAGMAAANAYTRGKREAVINGE